MPKSGSIKKLPSVSFKYISFPIKRSLSNKKKITFLIVKTTVITL